MILMEFSTRLSKTRMLTSLRQSTCLSHVKHSLTFYSKGLIKRGLMLKGSPPNLETKLGRQENATSSCN